MGSSSTKRIAVLMGGNSAEREVSLKSGAAVLESLQRQGYDAEALDVTPDLLQSLQQGGYQLAFIALHGRGGEDGVIQGALESIGLPYTGSGVLASALAMDKWRTKQIWQAADIPTPSYQIIAAADELERVEEAVGYPMMIKPIHEGSSIGMSRVEDRQQLEQAFSDASRYDREVMAERWIEGSEYTVAILDGEALPAIRLETPHQFYDYSAKYSENTTQYHCPCGLDPSAEQELQQLALRAFDAVGATGWGRVDILADESGGLWPIEVNTIPGMTDHSLVPMAAASSGIDFDGLTRRILEAVELDGRGA